MKYQQLVAMPASVQDWLDHELETRGIDAVVYTRYILSLLQQENFDSESADSELFPTAAKRNLKEVPVSRSKGKSKLRAERFKSLDFEEMRKSAAVECLMSVSDQKCGIEKLVDELCDKLKNIQGNDTGRCEQQGIYDTKTLLDPSSLASSSPEEQAEKYYAAFPALCGSNEPLDLSEAQNVETAVSSVWDKKKMNQKQDEKENEENENICNAEENENICNEEENEDIKEANSEFLKMEIKIETDVTGFGDVLGTVDDIVKPSFIVPKYKTNATSRRKFLLMKGKSPFNLPQQIPCSEPISTRNLKKRIGSCGKFNFDQHSEENTEESSLDNSFDDDFPIKSSLTSTIDSLEEEISDSKLEEFSDSPDVGEAAESKQMKPSSNVSFQEEYQNKEVIANLAAKLNDSIAAIWSGERSKSTTQKNITTENIWQALPFHELSDRTLDSAPCFPQELKSLFSHHSDSSVNLLWLHSKLLGEAREDLSNEQKTCLVQNESCDDDDDDDDDDEMESSREATAELLGECTNAYCDLPFKDLIKNTLWGWQADESFIQGGVYGSVLSGNKWKISNSDLLNEVKVIRNSPLTDSDNSLLESEIGNNKNANGEDEMQFVWNILGNLDSALQKERSVQSDENKAEDNNRVEVSSANEQSFAEDTQLLEKWNESAERKPLQITQFEDKLIDLKSIWNSMHVDIEPITIKVPPPQFSTVYAEEKEAANSANWAAEQLPHYNVLLTRSYDSYLNKMLVGEAKEEKEGENAFRSEPTLLSSKNCTLTYHKGESRFVEVKPSPKTDWLQVPMPKMQTLNYKYMSDYIDDDDDDYDDDDQENLLTSPKTHFRPIRQDSCESDSTGSSENGEEPTVAEITNQSAEPSIKLSESKDAAVTYDMTSLFLSYKDDCGDNSSDELCHLSQEKKENVEKFCQTEECCSESACSPMEKTTECAIERDTCTDILNAVIDVLDGMLDRKFPGKENLITDYSECSSKSLSPLSLNGDDVRQSSFSKFNEYPSVLQNTGPKSFELGNSLYCNSGNMWRSIDNVFAESGSETINKWSTAQEEKPFWYEEEPGTVWNIDKEEMLSTAKEKRRTEKTFAIKEEHEAGPMSIKSLREEIKDEEEQLFEDIDHQRILNLETNWGSNSSAKMFEDAKPDWLQNALALKLKVSNNEEICPELEMIHRRRRAYSSSDADDGAFADVKYSDYNLEAQDADCYEKLPVVPMSKILYSADLEEEWRKSGKPFDMQIPKIKYKKMTSQKRPCSFYLEGNCRRSDCKFSHDLASITCRFWEEGSCFKGITCPFLHGYHSDQNKEKSGRKSDFKLELESETHFPSLSKQRLHSRKQELCHSSSSDSTPMAPNKRRRKRVALKQRLISPNAQQSLHKNGKTNSFSKESRNRRPRGSSSDDDIVDI